MEINVRDKQKIVEVWLTNAERDDPAVKAQLKPLYAQYKQKKYTVAVFQSGGQNLSHSTLDLLIYNQRRLAELEVQREKKARLAMER